MSKTDITNQEWLAEVQRVMRRKQGASGFTTEEFAELLGCAKNKAREIIKRLYAAGVLDDTGKREVRIMGGDGATCLIPVYRIKKK